jgi:hypothetical protein
MTSVMLILTAALLGGCAKSVWVQDGKSRWETRQDAANCAEGLWKERKITIDTSDEERRTLLTPCMEEKGYRRL